jgi:hypothetical protein
MSLLDDLLGDLVYRSTGFRAGRLVRKIGAKNILLLGGAALAGGLAAQSLNRPASPQPVAPPPPPPPLPPIPEAPPPVATLVRLASALGLSEERRRSIEQEIFA